MAVTGAVVGEADRQQHMRDRITAVDARLTAAQAEVDAAAADLDKLEEKLHKQRQDLGRTERAHQVASEDLTALLSARDAAKGELASLNRRLQMATIVRESRS